MLGPAKRAIGQGQPHQDLVKGRLSAFEFDDRHPLEKNAAIGESRLDNGEMAQLLALTPGNFRVRRQMNHAPPAGGLGGKAGLVGTLQQAADVATARFRRLARHHHGEADADAATESHAIDGEMKIVHRRKHTLAQDLHHDGITGIDDHSKLVAADTRHVNRLPREGGKAIGDAGQEAVSRPVAGRVIDQLETVEVEKHDAEPLASPQRGVGIKRLQPPAHPLLEGASVGDSGQVVLKGEAFEPMGEPALSP